MNEKNFIKKKGTYKSSNDNDIVTFYIYYPLNNVPVRAVLQLSHGMCEYVERYEIFADFLCKNGIVFCGNDHIGHKGSIKNKSRLGYFANENGNKFFEKDLFSLTNIMKKKYPNIPYFLLGHSMGSFIARDYISKHADILTGAIICGTSGTNIGTHLGIALCNIIGLICGEKHRSSLINKMAFLDYNIKFMPIRTQFDWLTKDNEVVDKYINDDYCNFIFTTSGFRDLFTLLKRVSSDEWVFSIKKDLPVYLVSGDKDPVGQYGKGVKEVYCRLKNAGAEDISITLYKDDRHEILNETDKDIVMNDILNWIEARI